MHFASLLYIFDNNTDLNRVLRLIQKTYNKCQNNDNFATTSNLSSPFYFEYVIIVVCIIYLVYHKLQFLK